MLRGVSHLLYWLIFIFFMCLILRMIISWVEVFRPSWKPKGFVLVIAETVYSVTDWPLQRINRYIKPVRIGDVGLDIGFTLLTLICVFLMGLLK